MADTVAEVTDNNFQAEVIESEVPVLVDFWAPWCGPCRMVAPVVEEIAEERGDQLKVVKLNIDENQNTAVQFNVLSIPLIFACAGTNDHTQVMELLCGTIGEMVFCEGCEQPEETRP